MRCATEPAGAASAQCGPNGSCLHWDVTRGDTGLQVLWGYSWRWCGPTYTACMEQHKGKTVLPAIPGFPLVGNRLVGSGELRAEQDVRLGAQEQGWDEPTWSEKTPLDRGMLQIGQTCPSPLLGHLLPKSQWPPVTPVAPLTVLGVLQPPESLDFQAVQIPSEHQAAQIQEMFYI